MENYKLVIEFMDWGPIENDEFKDMDNWSTCVSSVCSWEYLKPVILYIRSTVSKESNPLEFIHLRNIVKSDISCDLDETFKAIVEFIKEYNKKQ